MMETPRSGDSVLFFSLKKKKELMSDIHDIIAKNAAILTGCI